MSGRPDGYGIPLLDLATYSNNRLMGTTDNDNKIMFPNARERNITVSLFIAYLLISI
jgi:hypothetical protein